MRLVVGEGGEGLPAPGFADFGEVEVNEGGFEAFVAEVGGDLPDMGSPFEEVGGVAVAEGVDDKLGVFFGEAAFDFGDFPSGPGGAVAHGFAAVVEGLPEAGAGTFPTAPRGRKEPAWVAVPGPEATQPLDEFGGNGDVAFVAAFGVAMGNADGVAPTVDVGGLEVEGFAETQAALVDGGEEGAVATVVEGAQKESDFLAGEDVREGFLAFNFDLAPDLPAQAEVVLVEGADGAEGLVDGAGGEVALGLEVEEEVEDLSARQVGKVRLGVVTVELPDPAEVGFGRSLAQSFELDKAGEFLIPILRSEAVILSVFLT